jgi:hypothetical protein
MNLPLNLSMYGSSIVKWWVDALFASRNTMKSQSGATMFMGKDSIYNMSRKQKLSTKSSTEAELVGAYNAMSQIVWTQYFLLARNIIVSHYILLQDNKSAMLLEKNGTASSSKST